MQQSALKDFYLSDVHISGTDAGEVSFADGWMFDDVTLTPANNVPLKVSNSGNMKL
jgi:hypothetical protein